MSTPPQPFSLSNLMPAPAPPAAPAVDVNGIIAREVDMMKASGWTLYQRWPGGADFTSATKAAIPTGAHIILAIFTFGVWLLIWAGLELLGFGGSQRWCRLTVAEDGTPGYATIGRPQAVA